MRFRASRAAPAALLLVLALCSRPAAADTLTLTRPVTATCVTDDSAVFTVQDGGLLPVRGQFMIFPPGSAALHAKSDMPADGEPGQLIKVYAYSAEPLDSLSVEIGTAGKTPLSRGAGFRAAGSSADAADGLWVAFLGIPTWGAAGDYTITLTAAAGQRSFLVLKPFEVNRRAFFSERIPLNTGLTDLVTSTDAQKVQETRDLVNVLSTPHTDAVFETGQLLTPLPGGRRTSGYGDRRELDYSDGTKGYTMHLGADIASPEGTLVPSSGRGRVVFASPRILTGNTIIVEHLPGLFSVYYHLSAIVVSVGDMVDRGQVIGKVGMTGFATGPHLHWEIENLGVAVDPDEAAAAPLLDKPADFQDIDGASGTEGR